MKLTQAFWGILLLMLTACNSDIRYPAAPDDLISEEQMVILVRDMTILEAGIQNRYQHVNRYYKTMIKSGDAYLKSKGIDPKRYERSYDYYVTRPEIFQRICTEAMEQITIEQNTIKVEKKDTVVVG